MTGMGEAQRGKPLVFFALMLLGWAGLRIAIWENPFPVVLPQSLPRLLASGPDRETMSAVNSGAIAHRVPALPAPSAHLPQPLPSFQTMEGLEPVPLAQTEPLFAEGMMGAGHNALWMAASAYFPIPTSVGRLINPAQAAPLAPTTAGVERRLQGTALWQMDGWLMMRSGSTAATGAGERPAAYGSSQAGAVLSFRLAPSSLHRPAIYARASKALVEGGESELALGLRARPLAALPLDVHAELRATRSEGMTELRPSAFVTGGLERDDLPLGLLARGYGQAGWVGGKYATGFVDGQIVAERDIAEFDLGQLSAGIGTWGGAQRGAKRLDIGPTASFKVEIGDAPARLSADYRIRVAGDAAPGSGVAVTLIGGF